MFDQGQARPPVRGVAGQGKAGRERCVSERSGRVGKGSFGIGAEWQGRRGGLWLGVRGPLRCDSTGHGSAGRGRLGKAYRVMAQSGTVGRDKARVGTARQDWPGLELRNQALTEIGVAWQARYGCIRLGTSQLVSGMAE